MSWRNMYSACNNLIEVDAADLPKPWNPQDCWCVGWPTLRNRSKNYEHCNVYVFLACRQLVTTFMCIAGGTSSLDQLFVQSVKCSEEAPIIGRHSLILYFGVGSGSFGSLAGRYQQTA